MQRDYCISGNDQFNHQKSGDVEKHLHFFDFMNDSD